ncbi:hypothetical protein FCJ57_00390 [Burkholderia diffusa]|nr:hypothetical protein [Burkholderia diffusa]
MRRVDAPAPLASSPVDVSVATSESSRRRSPLPAADRFTPERGDGPKPANRTSRWAATRCRALAASPR